MPRRIAFNNQDGRLYMCYSCLWSSAGSWCSTLQCQPMGDGGNPSPPGWHQDHGPGDRHTRCQVRTTASTVPVCLHSKWSALHLPEPSGAVQAGSCCNKLRPAAGQWRHIPLGSGHVSAWGSGFAASNRLLLADLREPFCLCSGAYVNLVTSGIPQAELTKVGPLLLHARTCLCWYGWAPLQASPG